ncbi:MAG TPA: alpha/beta hydrolase [Pseudonocardiaceae bacterium]|nr:alpha/beta hydrolase [Pseudonocardiaceae bacterium]
MTPLRTRPVRRILGVTLITFALGTSTVAASADPALIPAADQQLSFTQDGTTAYGTLHIPAHRAGQRLAAALLLPGSGPTDRNGNQLPSFDPDTLQLLAGVLDTQGIASFRFDKYFSGQTGGGAYADDPGKVDLSAFIRQADAAYRLLSRQPEVNPARLLVLGHSEGGFTSVLVAESVWPRPAGLALIEPQDERLLDLLSLQLGEQLDAAVAAGQLTETVAAQNKAGIDRVIAEFRAGQAIDYAGLLPSIAQFFSGSIFNQANANYVRSDDAIYPPNVARGLAPGTRVLVTCGTADTNVPCSTTPALLSALRAAHTNGPGLVVLAGLDHELHPAGDSINDQILAPAAIDALTAFARPFARPAR